MIGTGRHDYLANDWAPVAKSSLIHNLKCTRMLRKRCKGTWPTFRGYTPGSLNSASDSYTAGVDDKRQIQWNQRMPSLPDDALVVRGGENLPESFAQGSGVTTDAGDRVQGVSVNAGPGLTVGELTAPNAQTGYPGIPHNQVGVTTVGKIRAQGGVVNMSPRKKNPNHATLSGLTAKQASDLFRPTIKNPSRKK